MTYREDSDYEGGSGSLQYGIKDGDQLTLEECIKLSIVESDIATNMIFRFWWECPGNISLSSRMNTYYGMNYEEGMDTAAGMESVLIRLVENPYNNPHYDRLIGYMKHTTFDGFVTHSMKQGTYAHKFGDYEGYIGDIGIVNERKINSFLFIMRKRLTERLTFHKKSGHIWPRCQLYQNERQRCQAK